MKKILLYGNGSFDNLGCQALSLSTNKILKSLGYNDVEFLTFGSVSDYDVFGIKNVRNLKRDRESFFNLLSSFLCKIGLKKIGSSIPNLDARKKINDVDVAFSIGGDNYCYEGRERFFRINKEVKKKTKKMIFWGTSIEQSAIEELTIKDLKTFDLIIARETLTYNLLKENQINNVVVIPDPAFVLDKKEVALNIDIDLSHTVGINLSPLIYSYSKNPDLVEASIKKAIDYILKNTGLSILFFSHVYGDGNDLDVAKNLIKKADFKSSSRIHFLDIELNSMEIKYIISRMHSVICARTHASIAAYSSCVPTLVLGYSIKSKGIANDIFGTYAGHVVPVQELDSEKEFVNTIKLFIDRNDDEKTYLNEKMPKYMSLAEQIGDIIEND